MAAYCSRNPTRLSVVQIPRRIRTLTFQNPQIDPDSLPRAQEIEFQMEPAYPRLVRLVHLIVFASITFVAQGSWGLASNGDERPGGVASHLCGNLEREDGGTCMRLPAPPRGADRIECATELLRRIIDESVL